MAKRGALPTREQLVSFIQSSPSFPATKEVAKAFHLKGEDRRWLRQEIKALAAEGLIERKGRRLAAPGKIPPVAVISVTEVTTDGDVVARYPEADNPDLKIIIEPNRRGANPTVADRVLARLEREDDNLYRARPIRILERQHTGTQLGVFHPADNPANGGWVRPVDRKAKRDYLIPAEGLPNGGPPEDGELVMIERLKDRTREHSRELGPRRAKIIECLGPSDSIAAASAIALAQNEVRQGFPDAALELANAAQAPELGAREDLRDIPLVTIDGVDARDFDDAVYAQPTAKGGFRLLVAIADVSSYVRPGDALDQEAQKRGNSVYLPDRVVPMLPEALSNGWCSLVPDQERACLAIWMTIDAAGKVTDRKVVRGLMRSAARLTYTEVQTIHDEDDREHPRAGEIANLFGAYRILEAARQKRGTLELDLPEFALILDEARERLIDVRRQERLDAHKLIEEFMILANVCAAEILEQRNHPLLFRTHDAPDRAKLEALNTLLKTFSLPSLNSAARPSDFARVLKAASDLPSAPLISEAILRSQSQAHYTPENRGHFGLALSSYAHFTSPIRRYADLIVHRALIAALELPGHERDGFRPGDADKLPRIGEAISATERAAAVAERSARERILTHHLAEREGASFGATIVSVTKFGCFVSLDELGAQGLLPFDGLPEDRYQLSEDSGQLVGQRWGEVFSLGDRLVVTLREVEVATASLTFEVKDRISAPLPVIGKAAHRASRGKRPSKGKRRASSEKTRAPKRRRR